MAQRRSESKGFSHYLRQISEKPILTRLQEEELLARMGDDPDFCRAELVASHLRLVVKVAKGYRNMGLSLDDLVAEGNVGLLKASRCFNPTRGVRFMTCAIWWIRKSILDALDRNCCLVRIPDNLLRRVRTFQADLRNAPGDAAAPMDPARISRRMTRVEVEELLEMKRRPLSLDAKPHEGNNRRSLLERLTDLHNPRPGEALLQQEARVWVLGALTRLSDRERLVLQDRFGFDGGEPQTFDQAGRRIGVSGARAQQIEVKARQKLRRYLEPAAAIAPERDGS